MRWGPAGRGKAGLRPEAKKRRMQDGRKTRVRVRIVGRQRTWAKWLGKRARREHSVARRPAARRRDEER